MKQRTTSAMAFVDFLKRDRHITASWADVSEAYDAGLRHGLTQPKSAIDQLQKAGWTVHNLVKKWANRRLSVTEG